MHKFDVTAYSKTAFEHTDGAPSAKAVHTTVFLHAEAPLDTHNDDGTLNLNGMKLSSTVLAMGIATNIHAAHAAGIWDSAAHLRFVIDHLEKLFVMNPEKIMTSAEFGKLPGTRKTTHQHLVWELTKRNKEGKFDEIIRKAKLFHYHDFKAPENDDCNGFDKLDLVNDLQPFLELADILQDVINGIYDESPDEQDRAAMRKILEDDGAGEDFIKAMGL